MADDIEPPKPSVRNKGGRPKLKEGEKGNYHVSRTQKAKTAANRRLRETEQELQKLHSRRTQVVAKKKNIQKIDGALSGKKPSVLTEEDVQIAPKAVRDALQETTAVFTPNPGPQSDFLAAPEKEVLYGGAAGGGKSYAMLVDLLRYAHNGNHRALLLRRTLGELTELVDKSRELYTKAFPGAKFKEAKSTWVFPSGATALFSYVDRDSDVSRYQGQAFSWIGIDELGHYPTPYVWNYLRSRLRSTDPEIELYMRGSANPGGPGSWWLKKMFIEPAPHGEPFWARDIDTNQVLKFGPSSNNPGKPLFQRRFIPARLTDNPFLMQNDDYAAMLWSLPEVERKRLLEGDWDVADGAAFEEFHKATHVVAPFEVPVGWTRIRSGDYGYASPSCILWGAVDWDGNIWVYRELYIKGLTGESLGRAIINAEMSDPPIQMGTLDASCWNKTGSTGPSIAESMTRLGLNWIRSDRNRIPGKIEVHRRLATNTEGRPKLFVFSGCQNLIRTMASLPLSKTNPEDVDTKAEDHAYDALRYMCMARPIAGQTLVKRYQNGVHDYHEPFDGTFGY